ncbi:MAG TPA: response regulator transcription factor [Roseiarcus sp.]|jgi:two-component system OmpR family response regulator|nr:response regulator transcription factor [Roseiarcus sp.]
MRVMLVEDEEKIATEVACALTEAGYLVEIVGDGEEAWFRGETESYDGIVLDLGLPKLDGISVLTRLRDAGIATPILILSARGAWMERVAGVDAGADDYLPKPFHPEELIARLGAIIRRAGAHTTSIIEVGPARIDTRRMSVTVRGRQIALSRLEYRALWYLANNKGRPVPQGEFGEHVYGGELEPDSNALEVLVGRLRKKLGPNIIATQRGFGYLV